MSKKNIFGKMTYSQRFSTSSNSELSEEDEGLAALIADIQATAALVSRSGAEAAAESAVPRPLSGASREQRYIDLMRTMQFESFEMIAECPENGFRFTVPYHFEGAVRAAGARAAPRAHEAACAGGRHARLLAAAVLLVLRVRAHRHRPAGRDEGADHWAVGHPLC
ncbi:hypothetical protein ACJJTC_015816 [Scirpophaga incertulas]